MKQPELQCTVNGRMNCTSSLEEKVWQFLIKLLYEPTTLLPDVYTRDKKAYVHKTCVRMFTDLFIITKTRTQPKCPSTREWMNCAACIQLTSLKNKKQQSTVMCNNTLNLKNIIRMKKTRIVAASGSGVRWELTEKDHEGIF